MPLLAPVDAGLPFALAGSEVLEWFPTGGSPHCLVGGSAGSGKTATIRTLVLSAALRGYHCFVCETRQLYSSPDQTDYGFESLEWPNVVEACTLISMVLLVERLYAEMEVRYRRIRTEGSAVKRSLPPVVAVFDEIGELFDRIQEGWGEDGGKGEHPTIVRFRSLARLARTARIFLLVAIQRPPVAVEFRGEIRDNFRTRVACGRVSQPGAQVLGLSGRVSEDLPGRVMADVGGGWREAQVIWTPVLSAYLGRKERAMVERLRPSQVLAPLVLPDVWLPDHPCP